MKTWRLTKTFTFEAAHRLPHHDGKCARLHGHSWKGAVVVEDNELVTQGPKQGMVLDYGDLAKVLEPIVTDLLDHHYLNETLGMESPTSEAIAERIFKILQHTTHLAPYLKSVIIEETCTSRCEYSE